MAHLAAAPTPPAPSTPPRTCEQTVTAIYNDPRAGHEARELLLAIAYAVHLGPREDGVSPLREARRVLGRNSIGKPRYSALVAADAPRYTPPRKVQWHASESACEAPRLRPYRPHAYSPRTKPDPDLAQPTSIRPQPPTIVHVYPGYQPPRDWRTEDGVCGASAHEMVEEKDPRTGWITGHWFCKRHHDHAARVTEQVRAVNEQAPEPIPNTGGLLGCYFKADWESVYRHYAPHWQPPVYGICADDWPTPGETVTRGRLRILLTDTTT